MRSRLWMVVGFVLAAAAGPASSQVRLAWQLKEGDTFVTEQTEKLRTVFDVNGKKIALTASSTSRGRLSVKQKAPDALVVEHKIESYEPTADPKYDKDEERISARMKGLTYAFGLD